MSTDPTSRVLVADSTPHMASLVSQMLRALGRRTVHEAYDAHRAMFELKRLPFDILIVDADLAGLDGAAFTRKLRADTECRNRHIPVIMMSAAPDARRIAEARDAGITEFLRKPFAASHLQTRLESIAANPRGFIEADTYSGPDRRRRTVGVGSNERRRQD